MTRHVNDGLRLLVGVLLSITLVIWGPRQATADDSGKEAAKPADGFVEDSFANNGNKIRIWRFDPKGKDKRPAVLLLHGADGGVGAKVEKMYRDLAQRVAEKGYVVFIVHYLDATNPEPPDKISELVKRAVREQPAKEDIQRAQKFFDIWTGCVTDAVGHVRKQAAVDGERIGIVGLSLGGFVALSCAAQPKLKIAAVASGFGGMPKEKRDFVRWMPPTLIIHGDEDDVVPVQHAVGLRRLGRDQKLPIEVKIFPEVGHVFQLPNGKFDWLAMVQAERLMMNHFEKHLLAPKGPAQGK